MSPNKSCLQVGLPYSKLRKQFAEFLQHHSLKRLGILYRYTCVRFGYGHNGGALFLGIIHGNLNPIRSYNLLNPSLPPGSGILPDSIDYGFRPRLRGRLTLRRLALRRNPCTLGDRVFHSVCRYSYVSIALLIPPKALTGLSSTAYRTFRYQI